MKYDSKLHSALIELKTPEDSNATIKLDKEIRLSKDWDFEDDDEINKYKEKKRISSFNYLYNKYGNVLKGEPKPEKGLTKKQESALKKLDKLKADKIVDTKGFTKIKKAIEKNKSVKVYAEKLVFEYKGSKKEGEGININIGRGFSGCAIGDEDAEESSEEDELPVVNIDRLHITEQDFKNIKAKEIKERYELIQHYIKAYSDTELPDLPKSSSKAILKKAYEKVIDRNPEVLEALAEAGSTKGLEDFQVGQGMKKPKRKDDIHIDVNSHNVRNGRYAMGDGLGGALSPDDLVELRQMYDDIERTKAKTRPANILSGIKPTDISELMKKVDLAKEGREGLKENIELARRALKERLEREKTQPKPDQRFISRKTDAERANELLKKAMKVGKSKPKISKASKPKRISLKGSTEMAERMARLRAMRKSK